MLLESAETIQTSGQLSGQTASFVMEPLDTAEATETIETSGHVSGQYGCQGIKLLKIWYTLKLRFQDMVYLEHILKLLRGLSAFFAVFNLTCFRQKMDEGSKITFQEEENEPAYPQAVSSQSPASVPLLLLFVG